MTQGAGVDYHELANRLNLPAGWAAPTEVTYDDIRASALGITPNKVTPLDKPADLAR